MAPAPNQSHTMNQRARLEESAIPFIDVAAQRRRLGRAIDEAVARVLAHCQFINGPEVRALEVELAAFCGARHAIACSSGTDALRLALLALGIGPGDGVITVPMTFIATAAAVVQCGAVPEFVDVDPQTCNLSPQGPAPLPGGGTLQIPQRPARRHPGGSLRPALRDGPDHDDCPQL